MCVWGGGEGLAYQYRRLQLVGKPCGCYEVDMDSTQLPFVILNVIKRAKGQSSITIWNVIKTTTTLIQFTLLVWSCLLMREEKQLFLTGDETDPTVTLKASFSKANDNTDLTRSPIQEAEG